VIRLKNHDIPRFFSRLRKGKEEGQSKPTERRKSRGESWPAKRERRGRKTAERRKRKTAGKLRKCPDR